MTKDEDFQRLMEDRDDKESELEYIEDQIRLGHANEDEEDAYMNELQNAIMYIDSCLRDYEE